MMSFRRLAAAFYILLCPYAALASERQPEPLQALTRPYRSGDWVLQCDSSQICRVTGVVKHAGRQTRTRAIVVISRGIESNARFFVRFAFIDDYGFVVPRPDDSARLYSRGLPKMPPPLPLRLGAPEGEPAYPLYRTDREQGWRIVDALRRWPGAVLRDRGQFISYLPEGNLNRLLRKMDELQRPPSDTLSPAEQRQWLKEYHHTIVRAHPIDAAMPEEVLFACEKGPRQLISADGWQVDSARRLWIAHCPEGAWIFLQQRQANGTDYGVPVSYDLRDMSQRIRKVRDARFIADRSLLELTMTDKDRWDCGTRTSFGMSDQGRFEMIEHSQLAMCRGVPAAYWPMVWRPTSWKFADAPQPGK